MMKRITKCLASAVFMLAAVARAEVAPEAPWDTLAVIEIRGFNALADSVQRLGSALMIPVQKENLKAQLSFFLMTTNFTGLDPNGLIRIYVMGNSASPTSTPNVAISLPVNGDGEEYLDAIAERMEQTDSIRGVEYYKAASSAAIPSPWPQLCLRVTGGYVLVSQLPAPIEKMVQWIDEGVVRQEDPLPVEGDLAVSVNMKKTVELFSPVIEKQMEAFKRKTDRQTKSQPQDVGEILSIEQRFFMALMKQIDRYSIGLKTTPEWMEINFRTEASPGSSLEQLIGSLQQPAPAFQKFLPEEALYAQAGHWGNMDLWIEPYMRFVEELYGAMGPSMSGLSDVMLEMVRAMKGQYSGDVAMAVLPPTTNYPLQFVELIGVKDPLAMKATMEKLQSVMSQVNTGAMPSEISFQMVSGPSREYVGIPIDTYEYRTSLSDEMLKKLPYLVQRLVANMRFEMAYLDDAVIYTVGPSELTDQAIDRFQSGSGLILKESQPFKTVFAEGGSDAQVDAYYANLLDTLRSFMSLSPRLESLKQMLPPSKGTVAGFEKLDGQALQGRMRMSLTDVGDILKYLMALQSKMKTRATPTVLSDGEKTTE
jgi:hypothetical protein